MPARLESRPIRLLLVDDHPVVRYGLRARLQLVPGLSVVGEAGSAEEALARMTLCRPHLVMLDIGMKDVNGIQLIPLMIKKNPDLRVLMFSMHDSPEYVHRSIEAGAHGYLLKDAEAAQMVEAIEAIAAGQRYLSPAITQRLFRNQCSRPVISARESQLLSALARGLSSKDIAAEMTVSVRTVEAHRRAIKRKLALDGQAQLMQYAVTHAPGID